MYSYDRTVYSYDRRKVADVEELPALLGTFEQILRVVLEKDEAAIEADPDDFMSQVNASASVTAAFHHVKKHGIELLFYGLIQHYDMSTKDRKVIERASKNFGKGSIRRPRTEKAVALFKSTIKEYRLILETAQRVLRSGRLHTEEGSETVLEAGPFMLINAGGFDAKTMGTVQKVVEQAAKKLKAKGLGKVCYGSIQVTNTIRRSTRILAFYLVNKDQMFVRANLKGALGPAVMSVTHELGHRLHYKFLKSKDQQIQDIYERIAGEDEAQIEALLRDKSQYPQPGEVISEGRRKYVVTGVVMDPRRLEMAVQLERQDNGQKASLPLKNWLKNKGGGAFVSPYAATVYDENFAEMVAHYCEGLLPDDQVEMLKEVI